MSAKHVYKAEIEWTGNLGTGTSAYQAYARTWNLSSQGKPVVACSNDPLLGGDPAKYNPEDLLLAALSACHMLWYLHLCSNADITVFSYVDKPEAIGESEPSGKGRFLSATLKPRITIANGTDNAKALAIHDEIHKHCFIARSVNFPINYKPEIVCQDQR